jgi:hypothetical protein
LTEKDLKAIRILSSPKPNSPWRPVWSSKSLSGGRPALQASDLSIEVALLLEVRAHPGCGSVRLERGSRVASPDEEVAADRVEATIGVDPRVGTEALDSSRPARSPATMLLATAWLGATTGLSSKRSRTS